MTEVSWMAFLAAKERVPAGVALAWDAEVLLG